MENEQELENIKGFKDSQDLAKLKDDLGQMLVQLEHNQEIYQQIATLEEKAASLEADDYQGKC